MAATETCMHESINILYPQQSLLPCRRLHLLPQKEETAPTPWSVVIYNWSRKHSSQDWMSVENAHSTQTACNWMLVSTSKQKTIRNKHWTQGPTVFRAVLQLAEIAIPQVICWMNMPTAQREVQCCSCSLRTEFVRRRWASYWQYLTAVWLKNFRLRGV